MQTAAETKAKVEALSTQLAHQQAAFPPAALEEARELARDLEARAAKAEREAASQRQLADTWKGTRALPAPPPGRSRAVRLLTRSSASSPEGSGERKSLKRFGASGAAWW